MAISREDLYHQWPPAPKYNLTKNDIIDILHTYGLLGQGTPCWDDLLQDIHISVNNKYSGGNIPIPQIASALKDLDGNTRNGCPSPQTIKYFVEMETIARSAGLKLLRGARYPSTYKAGIQLECQRDYESNTYNINAHEVTFGSHSNKPLVKRTKQISATASSKMAQINAAVSQRISQRHQQPRTVAPEMILSLNSKVGDTVVVGDYAWVILEIRNNSVLLFSVQVISGLEIIKAFHPNLLTDRPFHSSRSGAVSWETSDMREYLNTEFYSSFDSMYRDKIVKAVNENNKNPWYSSLFTKAGKPTSDYVFLLSIDEMVRYFGDSGQIRKRPPRKDKYYPQFIDDEFNDKRAAIRIGGEPPMSKGHIWWLRSPGEEGHQIAFVSDKGIICVSGISANHDAGGIRPAMWLKI